MWCCCAEVENPFREESHPLLGQWERWPSSPWAWHKGCWHLASPRAWVAQSEERGTAGGQVTWVVEGGCQAGKARSLWLLAMGEIHLLHDGYSALGTDEHEQDPLGKLPELRQNHVPPWRRKVIFLGGSSMHGVEEPSDDLRCQATVFVTCQGPKCCRGTAKACQEYHWDYPKLVTSELWE